jgi:hypothetical protein
MKSKKAQESQDYKIMGKIRNLRQELKGNWEGGG